MGRAKNLLKSYIIIIKVKLIKNLILYFKIIIYWNLDIFNKQSLSNNAKFVKRP